MNLKLAKDFFSKIIALNAIFYSVGSFNESIFVKLLVKLIFCVKFSLLKCIEIKLKINFVTVRI